MEPQPGDFILVHLAGQAGWWIRRLQFLNGTGFADYEHVALYIGPSTVIEMGSRGIRVALLAPYLARKHRWSTGKIPLTGQQRHDIITSAQTYLAANIGYSWADYGALTLHRLGLNDPGLRRYIANTHHMICSQAVDQFYNEGGRHLFTDNRWPGYVTPGDLNRLLGPE